MLWFESLVVEVLGWYFKHDYLLTITVHARCRVRQTLTFVFILPLFYSSIILRMHIWLLLAPFYIIPFTECKNCTWNGFYGSLNIRQIGLRSSSSFLPAFQFPCFWTIFPSSDLFELLYAYSLDHYLYTYLLIFIISSFFNSKYRKYFQFSVRPIFDNVPMLRSFRKLICIFFEPISGQFLFYEFCPF